MASNLTWTDEMGAAYYTWDLKAVYGYSLAVGIMAFIGNGWLSIGIGRSKQLRSRFYTIILYLLIIRTTIAYQYIFTMSYYIMCTEKMASVIQTRLVCQMYHVFLYNGTFSEELALLALVVDCTVATVTPMFYRRLTNKQAVLGCVGAQVVVVCMRFVVGLVTVDLSELVFCVTSFSGLSSIFSKEYQTVGAAILVVSLLMYVFVMVVAVWRIQQAKKVTFDQERQILLRRQLSLLPLLRNMVGSHLLFTLLSRLVLAIADYVPAHGIALRELGVYFQTADLIVSVVVMLYTKNDLREACFPEFLRKLFAARQSSRSKRHRVANDPGQAADLRNPVTVLKSTNS